MATDTEIYNPDNVLNQKNEENENKTESLGLGLIANDIKLNTDAKQSDYSDALNSDSSSVKSISSISVKSTNDNYDDNYDAKQNNYYDNYNNYNNYNNNNNNQFEYRESDDDKIRKIELLRIFTELKKQGFVISQEYSMSSSLNTMEQEYEILKSSKMKKQALKLSQGFLINAIQTLEFLNTRFDPLGVDLVGFSEVVSLGIDDYNEVLDELYEKYKQYGRKVEPEIKLMLMIGGSAASFHASKVLLKNVPGMENLQRNPKFVNKMGKQFAESMSKPKEPPVPEEIILDNNISTEKHKDFMSRMRNKKVKKRNIDTEENKMELNIDI